MAQEILMLLENPRGRRSRKRSRNLIGYDEFGNPITLGGFNNPSKSIRRKNMSRRRNPALAIPKVLPREWTQGINILDAAGAAGGLAASTMLPGMIVRTADTTGAKIWKLIVSLGAAVGAGLVAKNISPSVGRAAFTGGAAGVVVQGLGMFTGVSIGDRGRIGSPKRLSVTTPISPPAAGREGEITSVIEP